MALKGDRDILATDIAWFMTAVASPGVCACVSVGGSGAALDQSVAVATVPANSSGAKPLGALLTEVVSIDTTKQHINFHKDQINVNGKVAIVTKGWVVTDKITGTPAAGDKAYLASSGTFSPTQISELVNPTVGKFLSKKDEDGYAKVEVLL
jgi:hypothetical protein